ncbi:MAG TPA: type II toxin-antitoxin system HipA family toxin [Longimicrobium sp.]|nr:type II toxin-antitoxin system HipA family toxin [Longimicrobium sp.]
MKYRSAVLVGGQLVAWVGQDARGRYALRYEDAWRGLEGAFPLSLSLPLTRPEHGDAPVRAYLWNLLPDNDAILREWGRRYHVSPGNPLALLAHFGEDCPGALQIVAPERVDVLLAGDAAAGEVEWLSESQIAERLRHLHQEPGAWREPGDPGQFSLAGAQPKTALLFQDGRWGVPSGRTPTTHILKPPVQEKYAGFAENEHVCLGLAAAVGLPAVHSRVVHFQDQPAIVVERFDRMRRGAQVIRLHQEDFCQALGVLPQEKYEADGGPGAPDLIRVLQERAVEPDVDVATVVGALALNWVIGGTDAHAKNYAHLMQPGGAVRLAPLYDIISLLPYHEGRGPRVKLAMRIGGEYRMRSIARRHWESLAATIGAEPDGVIAIADEIAAQVPDHLSDVCRRAGEEGAGHPVLERMQAEITANARACRIRLAGKPNAE